MATSEPHKRFHWSKRASLSVIVLIAVGLVAGTLAGREKVWWPDIKGNEAEALYLGEKSKPVEPSLIDPLKKWLRPEPQYRLMRLRRIPPITLGTPSTHPFVGDCKNCHLYVDGPPPGSQPKTPFGSAMERISKVKKLGPPLRPDSDRPHPAAGRCIKCHDIIIKVPIEQNNNSSLWTL